MAALASSERYHRGRGVRHKRLTDWARQLTKQMRRWLPGRELIMLADTSFAALALLTELIANRLVRAGDTPLKRHAWYRKSVQRRDHQNPSFSIPAAARGRLLRCIMDKVELTDRQ